jgi:predicted 2-oxoglutarate/Fe(II)-dependent dioxygenase YbiX
LLNDVKDYASEFGVLAYATGENWQLLKYGKGHHFDNHIDDNKLNPRTFSVSYYLNNNYEGGEIEFPRFDLKIKPEANQAIVFPANYVYNHKIYPVTDGTRYTIVNWFE